MKDRRPRRLAVVAPKIVPRPRLLLISIRRVDLIVTEMAVVEPTDAGLVLREIAPRG